MWKISFHCISETVQQSLTHRLAENLATADLVLTAGESARIADALAAIPIQGDRYPPTMMAMVKP
jgi:hypothetical protein